MTNKDLIKKAWDDFYKKVESLKNLDDFYQPETFENILKQTNDLIKGNLSDNNVKELEALIEELNNQIFSSGNICDQEGQHKALNKKEFDAITEILKKIYTLIK